jgi:hypothetical protein
MPKLEMSPVWGILRNVVVARPGKCGADDGINGKGCEFTRLEAWSPSVTSIMLLEFKRQISMQNTPSEIANLEQNQTRKYHKQDKGDALATHNTKRSDGGTDH